MIGMRTFPALIALALAAPSHAQVVIDLSDAAVAVTGEGLVGGDFTLQNPRAQTPTNVQFEFVCTTCDLTPTAAVGFVPDTDGVIPLYDADPAAYVSRAEEDCVSFYDTCAIDVAELNGWPGYHLNISLAGQYSSRREYYIEDQIFYVYAAGLDPTHVSTNIEVLLDQFISLLEEDE